jgi:hypothetical protein
MIAPIINMQVMLQANLIGKSFWSKLTNKRNSSENFKNLRKVLNLKHDVKKIQDSQMRRILSREQIEKEAATRRRVKLENDKREDTLKSRSRVAAGAKRARSSIVQFVNGKKKSKLEESFHDLGGNIVLNNTPAESQSVSHTRVIGFIYTRTYCAALSTISMPHCCFLATLH